MKWMISICVLACYISACNNNKTNKAAPDKDSTTAHLSPVTTSKEEEFQKLTPYSPEQMKSLLPVTLADFKLTESSSDKTMGAAFVKAVYQLNDSTSFEMSIYDCGGNEGSGFYKFQFLNMLNMQPEGEGEEVKTIDFNGGKAIEHYNNNSYRSAFTYLTDRFLVMLESESMDLEALKKIAGEVKLK